MSRFLPFLLLLLSINAALAQINIQPGQVEKIQFVDKQGSLAGYRETKFEISPRNTKWYCFQTKQFYNIIAYKDKPYFDKENAVQYKFIQQISEQKIKQFLSALNKIKPNLNIADLGLTPAYLKHAADSFTNRMYHKLKDEQKKNFYTAVLNKDYLEEAVKSIQGDSWTDDWPYCSIRIILYNRDTVKLESTALTLLMLPWKINGKNTYEPAISRFMASIMWNYRFSNKSRLSGKSLGYEICNDIYEQHCQYSFLLQDMQSLYPLNYSLLFKNFKVTNLSGSIQQGWAILKSDVLPANASIRLYFTISDSAAMNNLLVFRDTVVKSIKETNFFLNFFLSHDGYNVSFEYSYGKPGEPVFYQDKMDRIIKIYPFLKQYDSDKILFFRVTGLQIENSEWLLLPDKKAILIYFRDDATNSKLPFSLLEKNKNGFVLFDPAGKIITSETATPTSTIKSAIIK